LIGWITDEITEMVQQRIEEELMKADKSSIFIDGLYMNDPSLTSVLLMQTFHERMSERISKSAIAVPGYRLAFLSRLAFGKDESKYRVFYNSREEALAWLSS
jgi:hypothetical protein